MGEDTMKLRSNDFEHEGMIPTRFTCDDRDVSPHLVWEGVPPGTRSFALIVDDPDAPRGTWVHWLVANMAPDTREIPQGTVPQGAVQVRNDFRKTEYGGPCPPSGVHRYFFKLYALDVAVLEGVNEKNFYEEVKKHAIRQAVLMGKYARRR